ncbi:MAG TPA: iron ABC transporter substrate-binding protein [Kiritimatiellia bacterium]|nr:iron ABC transporter substrate-binding protein [Kiritimatiellia bacterium]HMO99223.1 iron ABC transporter substrate-binding protein [Kiritimatiellia bacterium]HMP97489.1 iron ABC transporter substrate-binding protein [Kiritimatiellia bacterium]
MNVLARITLAKSLLLILAAIGLISILAMKQSPDSLVVYCGRGEELIRPLFQRFEEETGIAVKVRYGGTAELAATILEEGRNSPADVFFAQDAGALGALKKAGRLIRLPGDVLAAVPARYRSPDGAWVGVSGRARVVVYNTNKLTEADLPDDLFGFVDPAWRGRLGWAPENGSFQSFVTALRIREGDERTLAWLKGIQANAPRVYGKNSALVAAVAAGEVDAGFSNHYYLYTARRTQPNLAAANFYFRRESAGNLVNVAGVGVLQSSRRAESALRLVRFLLSESAQAYFAEHTREYPLVESASGGSDLTPLSDVAIPDLDLNRLDDLEGTLRLLHEAGVL